MGKPKIRLPHRIKIPESIEIKFGTVDYFGEGTRHAKFFTNPFKGASRQMGEIYAKKIYLYTPFFLQRTYRSDLLRDFYA